MWHICRVAADTDILRRVAYDEAHRALADQQPAIEPRYPSPMQAEELPLTWKRLWRLLFGRETPS